MAMAMIEGSVVIRSCQRSVGVRGPRLHHNLMVLRYLLYVCTCLILQHVVLGATATIPDRAL